MKRLLVILSIVLIMTACKENDPDIHKTWAERLGFPRGSRVLILHADDVGMNHEANTAAQSLLENERIQSAAAMVPCPAFEEFTNWILNNPEVDLGLHLTLTSEWSTYRWSTVADSVPGLLDEDGFMWHEVADVVQHASADEVEKEIRAQIENAVSYGIQPGHLDTHMGTLYGRAEFAERFLKVAEEYDIPALVIEFTSEILDRLRSDGINIPDDVVDITAEYSLPKVDDFYAVPYGATYKEKKQNFIDLVQSLKPGITEIIFHPNHDSSLLRQITVHWQQRIWETDMFHDTEIIQFLANEDILFTDWKDIMARFRSINRTDQ
ncbi:MAG: polysaccharide deacetylase family protein [Candidatus Marinimicrobia bacterium]|nr:polysaccharide deacetylase family protein [Candidatus Neomarinimicrobiota bacterium]